MEERKVTPYYEYDLGLLRRTLEAALRASDYPGFRLHYALKANTNPEVLRQIASMGLGADTVSGGEILAAVNAGFEPEKILYAGVGKTDEEILRGLRVGIGCFNVESIEELRVISGIAVENGLKAPVCLRVNPNIDAHTHKYITTGLAENKFGISLEMLGAAVDEARALPGVTFEGFHFHIGSQLTDMEPYRMLCRKVMELVGEYKGKGIEVKRINVGGGLGINYEDPEGDPIPDFEAYFKVFAEGIELEAGQTLHFELGRALVGQCGRLITKVLYIKEGIKKKFMILDAGMTDLIRPALYGARHAMVNLSARERGEKNTERYDIVGPICESSDCFGQDVEMPLGRRGDIVAILSAGAYGEVMASGYNCRRLPGSMLRKL